MEATLTRTKPEPEKVIENINMAIYEIPDPPKIEIRDPLLNILSTDAEDILKYNYVNDKVLEDKTIEQIKAEFNFDDIKDAFDNRQVPPPPPPCPAQLEFFLVMKIKTLSMSVIFYHLAKTIMSLCIFCALTWDKT